MKVGDKVWYRTVNAGGRIWSGTVVCIHHNKVEFDAVEELYDGGSYEIGLVERPRKFVFLNPYDARNCVR